MAERDERRRESHWRIWIASGALAVGLLLLFAAWRPKAPTRLDLLTGPVGSPYRTEGERLAASLRQRGIRVQLVETSGGLDNLERLALSDRPTVAYVPSGIEIAVRGTVSLEDVVSLGSIEYEPLWLFARKGTTILRLADLAGQRVGVGPEGSTSDAIAELLLRANDLTDRVELVPYGGDLDAAKARTLLADEGDALFVVGGVQEPLIVHLVASDVATAVPIQRAETYAALFPSLAAFDVLPGSVSLARDLPPHTFSTLAATTNLLAKEDLHGALVEQVLDAQRDLRATPTLEAPRGVFPSRSFTSLPLHPRARQFYDEGPRQLGRFLPYRPTPCWISSCSCGYPRWPSRSPRSRACRSSSGCGSSCRASG